MMPAMTMIVPVMQAFNSRRNTPQPFDQPCIFMEYKEHEHIENKEDCSDFQDQMCPVFLRRTRPVIATGGFRRPAIDPVAIHDGQPAKRQNNARSSNHRQFPCMEKIMHIHHKTRHGDHDTQSRKKSHHTENSGKNAAEYMCGLRQDHGPDKAFLDIFSHGIMGVHPKSVSTQENLLQYNMNLRRILSGNTTTKRFGILQ